MFSRMQSKCERTLLDGERVDRAIARVAEAELVAPRRVVQHAVHARRVLRGAMQLPPQLADEREAHRAALHAAPASVAQLNHLRIVHAIQDTSSERQSAHHMCS